MKQTQVLVIGGGAGGLCAAAAAAESGARVTVLEKRPGPGKKLLATGNGRCNLANTGASRYFGDGAFAQKTLERMPVPDLLGTLEKWGLPLTREGELVYPACKQASAVLSLLTARLSALGGRIETNARVRSLQRGEGGFTALTDDGRSFRGDRCILATGGIAGGNLGSAPEDYSLAQGFGHTLTPLFPALAPLETDTAPLRGLSGLRLPAYIRLYDRTGFLQGESGEVLIADYGVSGICVMQLARKAHESLSLGNAPYLTLDLAPLLLPSPLPFGPLPKDTPSSEQAVLSLLSRRREALFPQDPLIGLLPEKMRMKLSGKPAGEAARLLSALKLPVRQVRPAAFAQATAGGVDTRDVDPETLSSRLCPGLYLTGEMLNVDGACGGFNLQYAMISGILAGRSAAHGSRMDA